MRHPAEAARIAWARIDLDHLEGIAKAGLQGREALTRRRPVLAEPQPDRAQPFVGGPLLDDLELALGHPWIAALFRRERQRRRRLAQHRGQHAVIHRGGQREAAGEALPDHADALAGRLVVEVPCQRPQEQRHRALLVGREGGEFLGHATAQDPGQHIGCADRPPRCAEQRRDGHGKPVVHQMISQPEHARMDAGQLRDQHHAGTLSLAVDVMGVATAGKRTTCPPGEIGLWCGQCCPFAGPSAQRAGNGGSVWVAVASLRNSAGDPAPVIAICVDPPGPSSRVVHSGSLSAPAPESLAEPPS
jgi:hypothetical protein